MTLEIAGIPIDAALHERVTALMSEALGQLRAKPVSAKAAFFDEDGPRNGRGIRCALTVKLPRRAPVHVERTETTARLAFGAAHEVLGRRLHDQEARRRSLWRRPKKYFAAERLLTAS